MEETSKMRIGDKRKEEKRNANEENRKIKIIR